METIKLYFPDLTEKQLNQILILEQWYPWWNERINVISRKDIGNLEVNHILHSLAIARFLSFAQGTQVLDLGTGGGFPGIPLAILFPQTEFLLIDRTAKKLRVAQDIAEKAELSNVHFFHGDVKEVKDKFDFVVSRAVMDLNDMVPLVRRLIRKPGFNALPNGLICLKGGDLKNETRAFSKSAIEEDLSAYFTQDYFGPKSVGKRLSWTRV